ncbi:telomerase reverse transcriptase-like [Coccinella septempunctata]|uniref:telomerase reverse transcriptase-like n=1 Tax=Coccinella septempunctata TaxID=41139 RepID=UPI001D073DF5|nr:telomerase reverse transcriptase-like [Coccinella septempunctata]
MNGSRDRYNLHLNCRKNDFSELKKLNNKHLKKSLISIRNDFRRSSSVIQCKKDVESLVHKTIPEEFFGCRENKKLFTNIVKRILNHRKGEYVHISLLYKDFERTFEWYKCIDNTDDFDEILRNVNLYLLEKCIKPFIRKHFFPVLQGKSYQIDLIRKSEWQSFRDKIFQEMVSKGHVKIKDKYNEYVPRGALRILPKENCHSLNYRPVICYYTKSETEENFKYLCRIRKKIKSYIQEKKLHLNIHEAWKKFVESSSFEVIYGVKADLKDSFGSINLNKLSLVLLELPKRILSDVDKDFLVKRIKKQHISFNNAKNRIVMRWCHGLLQGDRLSSVLCDLYYLELIDMKQLKNCLVGHYFFHRTVDDYIFCSTSRENVETFICNLKLGNVLNQDKIFSNILDNNLVELPYCGYIFNLYTKEVTIEFNMRRVDLRNKCKLWNDYLFSSPDKYLTSIMKFSSANFYFSKVIFNTHYNNEETIIKIYFYSMIYLGMKFHCAFRELRQSNQEYCKNAYVVRKKILEIIRQYSRKTIRIIEKFKGNLFHGDINHQMLTTIGVRAFILVFQKYSCVYKEIIATLKKQVLMKIALFGSLDISLFKRIPPNMVKTEN